MELSSATPGPFACRVHNSSLINHNILTVRGPVKEARGEAKANDDNQHGH